MTNKILIHSTLLAIMLSLTTNFASGKGLNINRFELDNGLQVWHRPRPNSSSAFIMIVFNVGSRNETADNNGISHFLEHLLFNGTNRWDATEVIEGITRRGGQRNAWTGKERTAYYVEITKSDLEFGMDWLSEISFRSIFPEEKIEKEREVVFQEKSGEYGWLLNTLEDLGYGYDPAKKINSAIYPNSSISLKTIGEDKSLNSLSRSDFLKYYKKYYTPNNATLIVSGGISLNDVEEIVEKYFGVFPKSEFNPKVQTPELPASGPHNIELKGPLATDQRRICYGARTVGIKHPDSWALKVLANMLDTTIFRELRHKRGLAYYVSASNDFYSDSGDFSILTMSKGDKSDESYSIVKQAVKDIRNGNIVDTDFNDAKRSLIGLWSLSMDKNKDAANWLCNWTFELGNGEDIPDYIEQISNVKKADLIRVVNEYFTPERTYTAIHNPVTTVKGASIGAGTILLIFITMLYLLLKERKANHQQQIPEEDETLTAVFKVDK